MVSERISYIISGVGVTNKFLHVYLHWFVKAIQSSHHEGGFPLVNVWEVCHFRQLDKGLEADDRVGLDSIMQGCVTVWEGGSIWMDASVCVHVSVCVCVCAYVYPRSQALCVCVCECVCLSIPIRVYA